MLRRGGRRFVVRERGHESRESRESRESHEKVIGSLRLTYNFFELAK